MRNLKTNAFGFAALVALLSVCLTPASGQQAEAPVVQRLFLPGMSRALDQQSEYNQTLLLRYKLEKAYQYEPKNSKNFVGWPIPDPRFDPAFQKYKDDPKFRDTVKALKKKYKN